MSRNIKKIQNRCIQTRLTHEGELIDYKLVYPITRDFKCYLQLHEPDEHDFVEKFQTKNGRECVYYTRSTRNFSEVRRFMYLIMIKSTDFTIKQLQNKKVNLVDTFSNL